MLSKSFGSLLLLLGAFHSINSLSLNPFSSWGSSSEPSAPGFPTFNNPLFRAPYKVCTEKQTYGIMKHVEVIPCESLERCPLVKGTNVTVDLEFIPSIPARTLFGSLAGVFNSMLPPVRFGKPEDLCASKQVECPLVPGKLYHFTTTVFVKQQYPRLSLNTKVLIQGDNLDIACALIPVEIMNKPNPTLLS